MNKFYRFLNVLAAFALFVTACGAQAVQAKPVDTAPVPGYQMALGKSLNDKDVVDFIVSNNCSPAGPFQLCKDAGLAFWIDSDQIVNSVYLYSGNTDDFKRYRGKLPFGLTFYDPMWLVEEKLRKLDADDDSQATWNAGLPDEASTPDHFHYWAVYNRFDMIVIYEVPYADQDAYIYAILVTNKTSL